MRAGEPHGIDFENFTRAFVELFDLDVTPESVVESTRLIEDLAFDSLRLSELYILLGDATGSQLQDQVADGIWTVADVFRVVAPSLLESPGA